jgi:hypothetical protein
MCPYALYRTVHLAPPSLPSPSQLATKSESDNHESDTGGGRVILPHGSGFLLWKTLRAFL